MTARSGKASRSATMGETSAYGSACSNCARAMRKSGVSHSRGCSRGCASSRAIGARSLGRLVVESAREPFADPGDGGRRQRLAEHAAEELTRLAHERLALRSETRMVEQELPASARGPVESVLEAAAAVGHITYARAELGGARGERLD